MDTNIRITADEMVVIENSDFFLSKYSVSQKIKLLLAEVRDKLKADLINNKSFFPLEADLETGKIFQGENYKLLPYIILDYPKMFCKTSVFSFRTMFWWGKNFSCTLHLEGETLEQYRLVIIKNIPNLYGKNFYFCINNTPWEYHFNRDNYIPLEQVTNIDSKISTSSFIKLSRKLEINQWQQLEQYASDTFKLSINILGEDA